MSGIIGGAGSKSGVIGTTELDYEEGTWTATNLGITGVSLSNDYGNYVKVGNLVTIHANISYSNTDTSVLFTIGGVPFPPKDLSGTSLENGGVMSYWVNHVGSKSFIGVYVSGTPDIRAYYNPGGANGGGTGMTFADVHNNFDFRLTITYITA
jgi:hypothetical protein